jgi:hypothetical protein
MTFKQIREAALAHRAALAEYEHIGERDWVCPDKTKISVRVDPTWEGDPVSLNVSRWVPEERAVHTLRDGTVIEGGYYDHLHDAHRMLSARQLRWLAQAREVAEQWVVGHINELPATVAFV